MPSELQLRCEGTTWRGSFAAMSNPCEVLCRTEGICEAVAAETRRIERKFSRYRDGSVVHTINTSRCALEQGCA